MKTALITGASRGIGAQIARLLKKEGYKVILTGAHDADALNRMKEELGCDAYLCDMGNADAVDALFASLPAIDVLINNAGISYVGLLSDMRNEDWRAVMASNLDSCFYACRAVIPSMVQKKEGKILNISSVWGNAGASLEVAYSASKGGINAFTKALAKELAPSNIQVNAIAPGMIDTSMNAHLSDEEKEEIRMQIPADRIGSPLEVAELALKILEAPSYLTGQIIALDGGWI